MLALLFALLATPVAPNDVTRGRYEAGVGLGMLAGPIVGAEDILMVGPALTMSTRLGGSLFLSFDVAVAPASGLVGFRGVSPGLPGGPMGRAAFGGGWHFQVHESVSISSEFAAFLGLASFRSGDVGGSAFAIGVSPGATLVWKLTENIAIAGRVHVDWSPLHTGARRGLYLFGGVALEPTFTW